MLQTDHPNSSTQKLNQISSSDPWEQNQNSQVTQDLLGWDRYTGERQAIAHDLIGRPSTPRAGLASNEHQPMGCLKSKHQLKK